MVEEALVSEAPIRELFLAAEGDRRRDEIAVAAERMGVVTTRASDAVIRHLCATVTPQGVVGVVDFVDAPMDAAASASLVAVLVEVRDPGNAGAIVRAGDAAGAGAVVLTRSCVDLYNDKTVRSTTGSLFHLPVVRDVDSRRAIEQLKAGGLRVLAASARGEVSLDEIDLVRPTAFLFGNESSGLDTGIEDLADASVRVPMEGRAESLGVASAAAVMLFEAARQRRGAASPGAAGPGPRG